MKPFNLDRAIAGDPVQTRDGRKVIDLHYFKHDTSELCLCVQIEGDSSPRWILADGRDNFCDETNCDLFMAPQKRTVYVNLWAGRPPRGSVYSANGQAPDGARVAHHFDTAEEAINAAFDCVTLGKSPHCIAQAVPVEIEE